MKFSFGLISILLTGALALSVKQRDGIPNCIEGDGGDVDGPFSSKSSCDDDCYMTEKSGDRVGQICKGYCKATPVLGNGSPGYDCFVSA
ncbi:hypothetical protein K505DRAFT_239749 [Melanomma pulvis-pyrius CBS 109.77]|uniref:Secreted protein n=1 Tax=Melanomma pulvis-pyrius CBS 109.77 TaxID=1314802 RepID=A0A6A6XHD4_9PLEO|nr:hypothetical protein K505DRAFT_239749 [Melanomma pulvis-pyrius CBS 109.77]